MSFKAIEYKMQAVYYFSKQVIIYNDERNKIQLIDIQTQMSVFEN